MTRRHARTAAEWAELEPPLPTNDRRGRPFEGHRPVIDASRWVLSTGAARRDLPDRVGPWPTPDGWSTRRRTGGTWDRVAAALLARGGRGRPVVHRRDHRPGYPVGRRREKKCPLGELADHTPGRGGFSTRLHVVCDRAMLPLGFVPTPGQQHEATVAPDLMLSIPRPGLRLPAKVAGDRGSSSPAIRSPFAARGTEPVIPHRRGERDRMPEPSEFGREAYRRRTAVGRLKEWRRIGTRFEKLAVNVAAMARLACIRLDPAR